MFRKLIFIGIMLFIASGYSNNGIAKGMKDNNDKDCRAECRIFYAASESNQGSQDKDSEDLEKQLKELKEEFKKLQKEIHEKFRKEVLPLIKKEIEKLREWLREFHPRDSEQEPQKTSI